MQIDVNGHVEATNEPFDMKLQRMVGHLRGDPASRIRGGSSGSASARACRPGRSRATRASRTSRSARSSR